MKNNKNLQNMFELIDDEFLEEADPVKASIEEIPSKKSSLFLKITSIVACALLILNIAIIVPIGIKLGLSDTNSQIDGDISGAGGGDGNQSSPSIIQKPTDLQFGTPNGNKTITLSTPIVGVPNEYADLINELEKVSGGKIGSIESGRPDLDENDETEIDEDIRREPTLNQAIGATEGDLIKRSDKHIYYLNESTVMIYSFEGTSLSAISERSLDEYIESINQALDISSKQEEKSSLNNGDKWECRELFLSNDFKTVTVVLEISKMLPAHIYGTNNTLKADDSLEYTVLISLNVEDPSYVYVNNVTALFGKYRDSRLVNGEHLVFTEFTPRLKEISIPQYSDGEGFKYFATEKIDAPSKYTTESYLLAFRIDGGSYKVKDAHAYASYDGEIYVSGNNIYLTREYLSEIYSNKEAVPNKNAQEGWEIYDGHVYSVKEKTTDILRVSCENGAFKTVDTVTVKGYLNNRHSMSQIEENLFLVTTEKTYHYYRLGKSGTKISTQEVPSNASLFCIDINKMAELSCDLRFAPDGTIVRAVKFDGTHVYVCTSEEKTDPVFNFDITYPGKITHTNTDELPGFSTTLIDYGNGKLLGIGEDGNGKIKVELYEKSENKVNIVDSYIADGGYSTDYHAYYVDKENGFFGFGTWSYSKGMLISKYVILEINNGRLAEVASKILRGENSLKRAVYVDGYFYLISDSEFVVVERK